MTIYKIYRVLISTIIAVGLVSCMIPQVNIPSNYQINEGKGVILISLTASGECGFAYFTEIRNITDNQEYSIGMQDYGKQRDWSKKSNECPSKAKNYFGKLVALEMPPGFYEIYQFEGLSKYQKIYSKKDFSYKFAVTSNKINYLGNLHFHVTKNISFIESLDNGKRDKTLFLERYKQFSAKDIIDNLLRGKRERVQST